MKHVGSVAGELLTFAQEQATEREREVRAQVATRDMTTFLAAEHGNEIANLFPANFTVEDYIATVSNTVVSEAKQRLKLCSVCPPHRGACCSDYEKERAPDPDWDRATGP